MGAGRGKAVQLIHNPTSSGLGPVGLCILCLCPCHLFCRPVLTTVSTEVHQQTPATLPVGLPTVDLICLLFLPRVMFRSLLVALRGDWTRVRSVRHSPNAQV